MRRTLPAARPEAPKWGSKLILYGAVAMIVASVYAGYYQVDTSRIWLNSIINTNKNMGIPVISYLFNMVQLNADLRMLMAQLLFLLALVILAFVAIGLRRRLGACLVMLPVCGACYWGGCALKVYSTDFKDLLRLLWAAPLIVIAVGCVLQVIHGALLRRGQPTYDANVTRRRSARYAHVRRTAKPVQRQFHNAPGATRMLPDVTPPAVVKPTRKPAPVPQRREQPVPDRSAAHIGEPPATPAQQPHYQWKTVKKDNRRDVIGQ